MKNVVVAGVAALALVGCFNNKEAEVEVLDDKSQQSECRENSVAGVPTDVPTYVDGNGEPCDPNAPAVEAAPEAAPAVEAVSGDAVVETPDFASAK